MTSNADTVYRKFEPGSRELTIESIHKLTVNQMFGPAVSPLCGEQTYEVPPEWLPA